MLLGVPLGVPIWLTVLGYFGIGLAWALAYLPHGIAKQANRYRAWKKEFLDGRTLEDLLLFEVPGKAKGGIPGLGTESTASKIHGAHFLNHRDSRFGATPMRSIMIRFMLNIAFWPCSILDSALRALGPFLERVIRAIGRLIRNFAEFIWDLILPVLRGLRRFAHWVYRLIFDFWNEVLAPAVAWLYRKLQGRYKAIIAWANREAIADLETVNKQKPTEKEATQ